MTQFSPKSLRFVGIHQNNWPQAMDIAKTYVKNHMKRKKSGIVNGGIHYRIFDGIEVIAYHTKNGKVIVRGSYNPKP